MNSVIFNLAEDYLSTTAGWWMNASTGVPAGALVFPVLQCISAVHSKDKFLLLHGCISFCIS